jgi:hypothetical protein
MVATTLKDMIAYYPFVPGVFFVKEMALSVGWVYPGAELLQGRFCNLCSPCDKQ